MSVVLGQNRYNNFVSLSRNKSSPRVFQRLYYYTKNNLEKHYLCSIFLTQNYTTMQTTVFLPLSPAIKSVTIIASIIILATMGYMAYQWYTTKQVMLLVTFVIVAIALLSCMVLIPRKLTVTTEAINIHLLAWKINIPADEIVKIEHYPHGIQSSRIAGAGGFFGNLGLFTCKECGKHLSLITDPMDVCIITRKSKMPIAVSIADNSVFNAIAEVQEKN